MPDENFKQIESEELKLHIFKVECFGKLTYLSRELMLIKPKPGNHQGKEVNLEKISSRWH